MDYLTYNTYMFIVYFVHYLSSVQWSCIPIFFYFLIVLFPILTQSVFVFLGWMSMSRISGSSMLFFIVAVLVCIVVNSAQRFPFLHILAKTCFLSFWFVVTLTDVKWYDAFCLHFPNDWWWWTSSHVPVGHLCLLSVLWWTNE